MWRWLRSAWTRLVSRRSRRTATLHVDGNSYEVTDILFTPSSHEETQ